MQVSVRGDRASISVRDTGIGIANDDLPRIFDLFTQGEQSRARAREGGLGLGLALVKGFVELHGGAVYANSEGHEKGAEFVLEFPAEATRSGAGEEPSSKGPGDLDEKKRVVLVIEDNVDAGESLAEVLALDGHEVKLARDGRSGRTMAREMRPQVIVCDIGLLDIDGYEVARELRNEECPSRYALYRADRLRSSRDHQGALEPGFDADLPSRRSSRPFRSR